MHRAFIQSLKIRLAEVLPAHEAHRKVMEHRKSIESIPSTIATAKKSAVLILLYPLKNELHTVFIVRNTYKGVHSGQIGLPGGKVEQEDSSLEATALREANEELAIQQNDLETLGALSPLYVPPSNFIIYPYVAFQAKRPNFIIEEKEVADYIETPLSLLTASDSFIETTIEVNQGQQLKVKGIPLREHLLWGATAMIMSEFVEVVKDLRSNNV